MSILVAFEDAITAHEQACHRSKDDMLSWLRGSVRDANERIGRMLPEVDEAICAAGKWPKENGTPVRYIGNDRRLRLLWEIAA